jgi:tRNA-dihydrouridine synthase
LGWDNNSICIYELSEILQDVGIQAISIHGRTRSQLYTGEADWTEIGRVKDNPRIKIPVFGNGDIKTAEKVLDVKNKYGVDGVLIGRASIGNPWIFKDIKNFLKTGEHISNPSIKERVEVCQTHLLSVIKYKGEGKAIGEMRKHYSNYFREIPHFKPLRISLLQAKNLEEVLNILGEIKISRN